MTKTTDPTLAQALMALADKRPVTLKDAVEAVEAAQMLNDLRKATGVNF